MAKFTQWFVLVIVAALWGAAFSAIKYCLEFVSPTELLILRLFPIGILALLILVVFYRKLSLELYKKCWPVFLTISLLWLYGYHYTLNVGETVLPAGPAGLMIGTYPIFTIFLAAIFIKEPLTVWKIVGGLVGFAGTAFLLLFGASGEGSVMNIEPSDWITYGLITMIAPVSAALHTIIARPYMTGENRAGVKIDSVLLNMLYMAPATVLLIPVILMHSIPSMNGNSGNEISNLSFSGLVSLPVSFWLVLLFLIIFCTLVAYIGWLWAVEKLGAGTVSISTYMVPIFSLVYARILLGETIGVASIIGAVGIIMGVIIATIRPKRKENDW